MKTLSVQQPWASLICAGIKDVENRTWKAAKVPGRILIHASSKKVTKNFFSGIPEEMVSHICNEQSFGNFPEFSELPTSAIIGYVTVTGFDDGEVESVWADGPGIFKWKLEDAWMFDEPILNVNGKLNLFEYEDIDENNLPPAHQVKLSDIVANDDDNEVYIPCEQKTFEKIKTGEVDGIEIYLTGYLKEVLCEEEGFNMKPFKTVTLECNNEYIKFELSKESGIFTIPEPQDESKPYMIYYHFGVEAPWFVAQFYFGKKIDEGTYDDSFEICGGIKYVSPELINNLKNSEDSKFLSFKVDKEDFDSIVNGSKRYFTKEITSKNQNQFFITDDKGKVKFINGVPQFRRYDAIQFSNKDKSYTCQINDADIAFIIDNEVVYYSEMDDEEKKDNTNLTDGLISYNLGEEVKEE